MKSKMDPLVSVVIPVYNVESYLHECVKSVVEQTYTNIEIILVDDGSTDNSGTLCDEFALSDSRICVFHKKMVDCLTLVITAFADPVEV